MAGGGEERRLFIPEEIAGSQHQTNWSKPNVADQTRCRWDTGNGSLETEEIF